MAQADKSLPQLSTFPAQMELAHKHTALVHSQMASASKVPQSCKHDGGKVRTG